MCKFSSIQDVLNGFILDGTVADYKAGELPLMHQHLKNVKNMIVPEKTIWTLDRGYPAMELYARIIEMNSYFIVRLRKDSYIEERMNITQEDSPISLVHPLVLIVLSTIILDTIHFLKTIHLFSHLHLPMILLPSRCL